MPKEVINGRDDFPIARVLGGEVEFDANSEIPPDQIARPQVEVRWANGAEGGEFLQLVTKCVRYADGGPLVEAQPMPGASAFFFTTSGPVTLDGLTSSGAPAPATATEQTVDELFELLPEETRKVVEAEMAALASERSLAVAVPHGGVGGSAYESEIAPDVSHAAVEQLAKRVALAAHTEASSATHVSEGWHVELDRRGANRLVKAVRRARNAAFGADE